MTWEKRKVHDLPLPSGGTRKVKRPGPALTVSQGRLQRVLKVNVTDKSPDQVGEDFVDALDDHTEKAYVDYSVKVVLACVVNDPSEQLHVVATPRKPNEITPDDIPPEDFWAIVGWYNAGCKDIPVETEEGETTVEAVETFPEEQGGRTEPGSNGQSVRENSIPVAAVM